MCSEYKSKEENDMVTNDKTPGNFKHAWTTETLIVGDSILTGVDN